MSSQELSSERIWRSWLAERNLRGLRTISGLAFILYPLFFVLDLLILSEPDSLWLFLGLRLAVCVYSAAMLVIARTGWARRHHALLSIATTLVLAWDLLAMVVILGGAHHSYYAGINLVLIGSTLLFLFDRKGTALAYGMIVGSWVLVAIATWDRAEAYSIVGNTLFLGSTALLVVVGQIIAFRTHREHVVTNQTLHLAKQDLEKAHDQLKELDQFKSQVFANITHELKTPLAMVLSPLELMLYGEMGRFSDEQMATIRSMFRSTLKLLRMIGDILDLSKLAESRVRLRVVEQDLVGYLEGLISDARPLTERKNIELSFESSVDTCPLWYDTERMERVFINLLSNAAKFTPLDGHIHMSLTDKGDTVEVAVADDGPGFPPDQTERLFERFVQAEMGSERRYGGTGIGLSLARDLVELHNGTIRADSRPGEGATFTVVLRKGREHLDAAVLDSSTPDLHTTIDPYAPVAGDEVGDWSNGLSARDEFRLLDIAEVTERRIVVRDPDEHTRGHTVLVIEDTADVIKVLHLALRQHFKFLAAQDGRKGLEMAREHRPDLIITDLMMPDLDGLQVTRRLRKHERTRHIPIIMLTARGDLEDRLKGLETGVNAYLAKPFSPRELLTTARGLLDIQETAADQVLTGQMDSMQLITGGLTHEINNPLNYLKNSLGFIRSDVEDLPRLLTLENVGSLCEKDEKQLARIRARIPKMLRTAETGVERIGKTVALMRRYSREGFTRLACSHDVFAASREVIDLIHASTGGNVEVTCDFEGNGVIDCVPEEFHQLMTNLVQNAIEASPESDGRVQVHGTREHDDVLLTIRDNGSGMDRETRDRIFTPFFTTKGPDRGMGLGLAIVWRIVRGMGGTIRVDSEPGQGAEFRVRLPVRRLTEDSTEDSHSLQTSAID